MTCNPGSIGVTGLVQHPLSSRQNWTLPSARIFPGREAAEDLIVLNQRNKCDSQYLAADCFAVPVPGNQR